MGMPAYPDNLIATGWFQDVEVCVYRQQQRDVAVEKSSSTGGV